MIGKFKDSIQNKKKNNKKPINPKMYPFLENSWRLLALENHLQINRNGLERTINTNCCAVAYNDDVIGIIVIQSPKT